MDHIGFWRLIDAVRKGAHGDSFAIGERLAESLGELSPTEVVDFNNILHELLARSYRWDLWGAAFIANGGCSDDGFAYFRAWLIAQGEKAFEEALRNPDSLARIIPPAGEVECENMLYVPMQAYEELTGREIPAPRVKMPAEPAGDSWEEDDLPAMFPNLAAKFSFV